MRRVLVCVVCVFGAFGCADVLDDGGEDGRGGAGGASSLGDDGRAQGHGQSDGSSSGSGSGYGGGSGSSDGSGSGSSSGGGYGGSSGPPGGSGGCGACDEPGLTNHEARWIAMHRVERTSAEWVQFMLTDAPGRLACRAVEDTDVLPAGDGMQLLLSLPSELETGSGVCPVGEYVLVEGDSCGFLFYAQTPARHSSYDGCAAMRRWTNDGDVSSTRVARSGLVTVRDLGSECRVDTELLFDGEEPMLGSHVLPKTSEATACGESI